MYVAHTPRRSLAGGRGLQRSFEVAPVPCGRVLIRGIKQQLERPMGTMRGASGPDGKKFKMQWYCRIETAREWSKSADPRPKRAAQRIRCNGQHLVMRRVRYYSMIWYSTCRQAYRYLFLPH